MFFDDSGKGRTSFELHPIASSVLREHRTSLSLSNCKGFLTDVKKVPSWPDALLLAEERVNFGKG